jgi:hypothetical protein
MKTTSLKIILLLIIFFTFNLNKGFSQKEKRFYSSTSVEMIFSFANVSIDSGNATNVMRWAPVLNVQFIYNFDFTNNFGLFIGLDVRNLGFIWKNDFGQKWKHRVYTLGLPVGIKLGNLRSGMFFYAGGQIEYAFNYKEKYFLNNSKQAKNVYWFTDRINIWQPSVLVGINFPFGLNIKFKYYFIDLLNPDYEEFNEQGEKYKPYAGFTNDKIFYFSLSYNMFHRDYKYFYSSVTNETIKADRRSAKKTNNW